MAHSDRNDFVKVGFNYARRMALRPMFQELGPDRVREAYLIAELFWSEFSAPSSATPQVSKAARKHLHIKKHIKDAYRLDEKAAEQKFEELKCRYLHMLPPEKQPKDIYNSWYQLIRREKYCEIVQPRWALPLLDLQKTNQEQKTFNQSLKKLDELIEDIDGDSFGEGFELVERIESEFRRIFSAWLAKNSIETDPTLLTEIAADFYSLVYKDSSGNCLTFKNLIQDTQREFGQEFWEGTLEDIVYDDLSSFAQWMHGVAHVYSFLHCCGYINEAELEKFICAIKSNEEPYLDFLRSRLSFGDPYKSSEELRREKTSETLESLNDASTCPVHI